MFARQEAARTRVCGARAAKSALAFRIVILRRPPKQEAVVRSNDVAQRRPTLIGSAVRSRRVASRHEPLIELRVRIEGVIILVAAGQLRCTRHIATSERIRRGASAGGLIVVSRETVAALRGSMGTGAPAAAR